MSAEDSELDHVLKVLLHRMHVPEWNREAEEGEALLGSAPKNKLVFLLGAGCSRQYGLPGFKDLLTYIWQQAYNEQPKPSWGLEVLRDKLDKFWQAQGPDDRKKILSYYLLGDQRITCPGYYHLAKLAKKGYVEAIINMNFDLLLENALREAGVKYTVSTSFQLKHPPGKDVIVYKPHGTIGEVVEGPVEDLRDILLEIVKSLEPERMSQLRFRLDEIGSILSQVGQRDRSLRTLHISFRKFIFSLERHLSEQGSSRSKSSINNDLKELARKINKESEEYLIRRGEVVIGRNELILDIANSDLFTDSEEQSRAQHLFTGYDVVSIGYSGVDAKIAAALRAFQPGFSPRNKKLFVVNATAPDPRLLLVMADRDSQSLLVTGENAAFENFMEQLSQMLHQWHSEDRAVSDDMAESVRSASSRKAFASQVKEVATELIKRSDIESLRGTGNGDKARFERLLEFIEERKEVFDYDEEKMRGDASDAGSGLGFMTRAERQALRHVRSLALKLRLGLNVAEQGRISIEEHADHIFAMCLDIAAASRVVLTSPERYMLRCVSYLHDLGYYRGYSRNEIENNPGWKLLQYHGGETKELLSSHFEAEPLELEKIIPYTFRGGQGCKRDFKEIIFYICEGHSQLAYIGIKRPASFNVSGIKISVRSDLLLAIFALAEDLSSGHPFLPSADPVTSSSETKGDVVVDPVLDFYLGQKPQVVSFEVKRGEIRVKLKGEADGQQRYRSMDCVLAMAAFHVKNYNRICIHYGGVQFRESFASFVSLDKLEEFRRLLDSSAGKKKKSSSRAQKAEASESKFFVQDLLREALEEALGQAAKKVKEETCKLSTLLDLVAFYSLDERPWENGNEKGEEPRIELGRAGKKDLDVLVDLDELLTKSSPTHGVLHLYFKESRRPTLSKMGEEFLENFKEIISPAWRFFARNWHDGIEATLMARVCLDLGSSRVRREVVEGIKDLLKKPESTKRFFKGKQVRVARGHEGCTLCTARLLYIFSHARMLFTLPPTPNDQSSVSNYQDLVTKIDSKVSRLLLYLLSRSAEQSELRKAEQTELNKAKQRDLEDSWWGLEDHRKDQRKEVRRIRSADYLAWAARSVAFCLSADKKIKDTAGKDWLKDLGIERAEVEQLLCERWSHLLQAQGAQKHPDSLLSEMSEEPHSYILGRVGLACLHLLDEEEDVLKRTAGEPYRKEFLAFVDQLLVAIEEVERPHLSLMSRLYLWPAKILANRTERKKNEEELFNLYLDCAKAGIWIREGADAGSWGFNVKNTQAIVTSLVAFWRHALARPDRFKGFFEASSFPITHSPQAESPPPSPAATPRARGKSRRARG